MVSTKLNSFRIGVFGFLNCVPVLTTQWSTMILPEIIKINLKIDNMNEFSLIAGYFYISYFYGMIFSSLIWPFMVKLVSKRHCILMSVFAMAFCNLISGFHSNIFYICLWRFLAGLSLNIHTVGKDFLFEFSIPSTRQFALSLDSCFGLMGHLVGPFLGTYIYHICDKSFEASCFWVSMIAFSGGILFIIAFYLFSDRRPETELALPEEENRRFRHSESTEMIITTNYREVIHHCIYSAEIRNLIILFAVSTACTNTELIISVLYLQMNWEVGGLGINNHDLSKTSLLSFIPAVFILIYSSAIVPKYFTYTNFIKMIGVLFSCSVLLTPLFRDFLPRENFEHFEGLVLFNQMIKYCSSSHIYSPFIHYLINKRANKHIRTVLNSINFVFSTLSIVILMNLIIPFLSISLYNPSFTEYRPFNKYLTFWIVGGLQLITFILMIQSKRDIRRI